MKPEQVIIGGGTLLLLFVLLTKSLSGTNVGKPVRPGQFSVNGGMVRALPIALPSNSTSPASISRGKIVQEGHWLGLEVLPLTAALAKANNIPSQVSGVLVDEVTLLSAEAGILAGDVIVAVNGVPVPDLPAFTEATRKIAGERRASLTVYRQGGLLQISVQDRRRLGFAQLEAAPMILATDRSPHGNYGACDRCHYISKTSRNPGQLGVDLGDVLVRQAPAIKKGAQSPHGNRGSCGQCHILQ